MRNAAKLGVSVSVAVGVGIAYSGFPRRMGLTRAQSLVSMPGDLVLPGARIQADRVLRIPGTPGEVWSALPDLVLGFEDVAGRVLVTVYEDAPELWVLQTGDTPGFDWQGSVAIRLVQGADDTTSVHIRERYLTDGFRARSRIELMMAVTAAKVQGWGLRVRNLLASDGK